MKLGEAYLGTCCEGTGSGRCWKLFTATAVMCRPDGVCSGVVAASSAGRYLRIRTVMYIQVLEIMHYDTPFMLNLHNPAYLICSFTLDYTL